ncbi:MAG: hypothetical protein LKF47_05865, partial [Megasphaera sp.]|nr:hypothetical protein [Megasphaera sp.]
MRKKVKKSIVLGMVCCSAIAVQSSVFATEYTSMQDHNGDTFKYSNGDTITMWEKKVPNMQIRGTGSDITMNGVKASSMDRTYNTVFKNYVGNVNIFGKENKLTIDNSTLTSATYGISA